MNNGFEKEFDDEVYEDEFYKENYDEEELKDKEEDDLLDDDDDDDNDDDDDDDEGKSQWDDNGEKKIDVSYACEDCDYRWDDIIIRQKDSLDYDDENMNTVCPMCGSTTITQI